MSAPMPRDSGAEDGRPGPREVRELSTGMQGCWLVSSQHSHHVWDLDAMTYTRIPGPESPSGPFALDLRAMAISRIDRWPRVGSTSLVWFDDPSDPNETEHWRQSSPIVTITEMGWCG